MSVATYNRLAARGADLIERFGRPVTLLEPGESAGIGRRATPGEPIPHAITVVQSEAEDAEIDGSLVRRGDRRYLVDASLVVTTDWQMIDKGDTAVSVTHVLPVEPGSVLVYQRVFTRS